jgi:hypothetical protein
MGSSTYSLRLYDALEDLTKDTCPCDFFTIVPFGAHNFYVIDSDHGSTMDQPRWITIDIEPPTAQLLTIHDHVSQ